MWIKFGLIVAVTYIALFLVKALLQKIFDIEKEKKPLLTNHYVNDLHRKVDKVFRISSTIILFLMLFILLIYFDDFSHLLLIAIFISIFLNLLIRAFFEWKYSDSPKQSILTLAEVFVLVSVIIVVFQFNLLF